MNASQRLADNYRSTVQRLADTAVHYGRDLSEIRLVAVSKYVDFETTWQLVDAGCTDLGESRPQQLFAKVEEANRRSSDLPVRWHLIGHLQRNKARRVWHDADWIHSVDSLRLLNTLSPLAEETGVQPQLLLEVNVSGDKSKHGFLPDDMPDVLDSVAALPLQLSGLMTMASREGGRDRARSDFAELRKLRDQLRSICPDNVRLDELSMGMSGDWEQAVAEGATVVRIGSALFEGVEV